MKLKDESKELGMMEAALRLIFSQGLAGLKMADIAREAGVAVGTVYVYFKDKEELLNAMFMHYKLLTVKSLSAGLQPEAPFKVKFRKVWHNYLHFVLKYPEMATFIEQLHRSHFLRQEVRKRSDELMMPVFNLLDEGKKQQLLKNADNELLLAQLSGPMHELARMQREGDIKISPARIEMAFLMAWDGVKL